MNASPKIGIYTLRFPKTTETWAVNKVLGLVESGADVTVFSRFSGGDWRRFPALADPHVRARVKALPDRGPGSWSVRTVIAAARLVGRTAARDPREFARYVAHNWRWRNRNTVGFWRGVYERIFFVGADLDVLHLELDTMAPAVADIKHYLGCRLILSGRSTLQYTGRPTQWPGGFAALFDYADAYHVECEYTDRNLRSLGLDPNVPIYSIPSSIDAHERFTAGEARHDDGCFRILSISRLAVEKGHEFGLGAVAELRRRGVALHYTIVGEGGTHGEAARFAAHQLGLLADGTVEFTGGVAPDEVIGYYREADVLLHASTDEGVPNVVLEAQAMGLPVVAAAAAGTPEAIVDGVTGYVVACRDSTALADRLELLARDRHLRCQMSVAAREHLRRRGEPREWIAAYRRLYGEVTSSSPAAPRRSG